VNPIPEIPVPEGTAAVPRESLATTIGRLAHAIDELLPPGDVAELRRLAPHDPGCPAFFKLVASVLPDGTLPRDGARRDEAERHWAVVFSCLATLRGLHRPGRRLGHALAYAEVSELRVVRLLRARGEALLDAVAVIARTLAVKGEAVDAAELARLLLDEQHAEQVRRRIARDYFAKTHENA
jgi:CRISPR system Cascade subunit CasB